MGAGNPRVRAHDTKINASNIFVYLIYILVYNSKTLLINKHFKLII